jgi:tRNA-splicing ligase RtcB
MQVVYEDGMKVPLKIWAEMETLESKALTQAKNVASLPFVVGHAALMGDGHVGYGSPIGMVAGLDGYVCPNFVGKDIGCGVCAIRLSIREITINQLKEVLGQIRKCIPIGMRHHAEKQDISLMPPLPAESVPIVEREYESARKQIMSPGSGNHFLTLQRGDDGYIWILLHSGSRNLGSQVADHYNKVAISLNAKYFSSVPEEWELAFLPVDSEEGQVYLREMQYCIDFALANRIMLVSKMLSICNDVAGAEYDPNGIINIAHNYAAMEHHFGRNVLVHRKGATPARVGQIGIVPGSQGTASYIVKGRGNRESLMSCSHGAGRSMGRNHAVETLNLEAEKKRLDEKGIIHTIRKVEDLEEAVSAYKDIEVVMRLQADLVDIVVRLEPLAVIMAEKEKKRTRR